MSDPVHYVTCPSCGASNKVPSSREGEAGKCGNCHRRLPALYIHPLSLDDAEFDSFISNYNGPVLVEFWAPW